MRTIARLSVFLIGMAAAQAQAEEPPDPILVTEKTRRDPKALAVLEKPGRVVFKDGFESTIAGTSSSPTITTRAISTTPAAGSPGSPVR